MAVKQLPTLSPIPEPPNRLVGDQERFDTMTFNSLKAQEKMVNEDLNKALIPALNQYAVDVNASVDAAKASETSALASKNSAASSATTATTKAGEAAASATTAKASETSALASKNAAGISATAAANAQNAAEAARDEAKDLANVGYASESHAGLAKVDGKTTQADAGGAITVKDVAIGGNLEDLASARGQIGNPAKETLVADFNDFTTSGVYWIKWNPDTAANRPPFQGSNGLLFVWFFPEGLEGKPVVRQTLYRHETAGVNDFQILTRSITSNVGKWGDWLWVLTSKNAGDGIKMVNDKFSVPEYDGATASTAGTSGLVPPATAGQQESFLTGGGEYKPALTKISDSVSLADSTMAASAKAVKTAYDLANAALPKSGGTVTGSFTVASPKGDSEGGEIWLKNGTDGKYPAVIDTTSNQIRFLGGPGAPVHVDLESGKFVGNLTGKADSAGAADNALAFANKRPWVEATHDGNPGWLIGSVNEQLRPVNTNSLSVSYADRSGYAEQMDCFSYAWGGNPNVVTVPSGGTWFAFVGNATGGVEIGGMYPGGAQIEISRWGSVRVFAFGIKWKS